MQTPPRRHIGSSNTLITVVLVVAVLYFARVVLIPFALALLLSFLLAPMVIRLRHWGFSRAPAVLSAVAIAFFLMVALGGLLTVQLGDLAHDLPQYEENVREKIHSIRDSGGKFMNQISRFASNFTDELNPPEKEQSGEGKPMPVEIRRGAFSPVELVQSIAGSLIEALLTVFIVIVFAIFMLFQREDLRDRLIRLAGAGHLNVATKALDEAGDRVSRYLVAQLVVNVVYGILVGIGLFFLGVPNPVLWGVVAALLRYIPYLGIWIAALMPAAVSFAVDSGWIKPAGILGLYAGIDILMYNFVEPLFFRSSTGISPMALLATAVFWGWLWGPVGLLLATPLTVCLVVIGRYVPSLEFLGVILSDEQVLTPEKRFYQRLLAMDLEEATEISEKYLKGKTLRELYDKVIIPALSLAEEDRHHGTLDEKHEQFILQSARMLVEDVGERADELIVGGHLPKPPHGDSPEKRTFAPLPVEISVLSVPARDEADEIGALMLAQLLNRRGIPTKAVSASALASERLEEAARQKIQVACVTAVLPFGYMHARYLCKRLRTQFPEMKIIAVILADSEVREVKGGQSGIASDEIVTSLTDAVTQILSLVQPAMNRSEPAPLIA